MRKPFKIAAGIVGLLFAIGVIGAMMGGGDQSAKATPAHNAPTFIPMPKPVAKKPTPRPSTPQERVREAIGSEVEAGGYAGTLEVIPVLGKNVHFEKGEAIVLVKTPEGGLQGASCGDLNDGARAVFNTIYDAGWRGGAALAFQGGLVSTQTGEDLSDVNTGIFTMPARAARQINWSNEDAVNYNIDWSIYRDFCHPALKQ